MKNQPKVPGRTTPGFAFSIIERVLLEGLGIRQFGRSERALVLTFFGSDPLECVFCGSPDVKRWDHLVAIRNGGETVLGNMVPACAICDDSKGDRDFATWMASAAPKSPTSRGVNDVEQRIARIQSYMDHYGYVPRLIEQRLTEQEIQKLAQIHANLEDSRQAIEELIKEYQTRIGGP